MRTRACRAVPFKHMGSERTAQAVECKNCFQRDDHGFAAVRSAQNAPRASRVRSLLPASLLEKSIGASEEAQRQAFSYPSVVEGLTGCKECIDNLAKSYTNAFDCLAGHRLVIWHAWSLTCTSTATSKCWLTFGWHHRSDPMTPINSTDRKSRFLINASGTFAW